jgi:hypothetical protein
MLQLLTPRMTEAFKKDWKTAKKEHSDLSSESDLTPEFMTRITIALLIIIILLLIVVLIGVYHIAKTNQI